MKLPIVILSILILISCQSNFNYHTIQPQNSKKKKANLYFPFTNYSTIKSYEFNKQLFSESDYELSHQLDSLDRHGGCFRNVIEYFNQKDSVGLKAHFDKIKELRNTIYDKILPYTSSIVIGDTICLGAKLKKELSNTETKELRAFFYNDFKEQILNIDDDLYREALIFYNENNEIVGTIEFSFQSQKVRFSTPTYMKIKFFYTDKWKQFEAFFKNMGHDMNYSSFL